MFDFIKNIKELVSARKSANIFPNSFSRAKNIAKKSGYNLTMQEIQELQNEINHENIITNSIISASKSGINISLKDAEKIYLASQNSKISYKELVDSLIITKKAEQSFLLEDLLKLTKEKQNIKKITEAIISAKKDGIIFSANEIKTLFYKDDSEYLNLTKQLSIAKSEDIELDAKQIKILYLKNISIQRAIEILRIAKQEELTLPFNILVNLLKDKINIIKCLKILSKAKKASYAELQNSGMFDSEVNDLLANTYVIEGKEEFKKKLSDKILSNKKMLDPAEVYYSLVKSKSKGFKISLDTIQDYITFGYTSDLEKIHDSYLYARENGLYLSFKHLALLAEKNVDVLNFVNAQINSGYHE